MNRLKSSIAVVALCAILVAPDAQGASSKPNNCRGWATEPGATTYSMAQLGCQQRPSGVWQAQPGKCAKHARRAARRGLRGIDVEAYAATKGCGLFNGQYDWAPFHEA